MGPTISENRSEVCAGGAAKRVFVSSVIAGYENFRAAAIAAINSTTSAEDRFEAVSCEGWPASDNPPAAEILASIGTCDILISLVGARCGSRNPVSGHSITEDEIRAAEYLRMPILLFKQRGVVHEPDQAALIARLAHFHDGHTAREFHDERSLTTAIRDSLDQLIRSNSIAKHREISRCIADVERCVRDGHDAILAGAVKDCVRLCEETDDGNSLAEVMLLLGDYQRRKSRFRDALATYRAGSGRACRAALLAKLRIGAALASQICGSFDSAELEYRSAADLLRLDPDISAWIAWWAGYADLAAQVGDTAGAVTRYRTAIDLATCSENNGRFQLEAIEASVSMFPLLRRVGDIDGSERVGRLLVSWMKIIAKDKQLHAYTLNNIGEDALQAKRFDAAQPLFEASLAKKREIGDHYGMAHTLHVLGQLLIQSGRLDVGWRHLDSAAKLFEELECVHRQFDCLLALAACSESLGRAELAASLRARARELAVGSGIARLIERGEPRRGGESRD